MNKRLLVVGLFLNFVSLQGSEKCVETTAFLVAEDENLHRYTMYTRKQALDLEIANYKFKQKACENNKFEFQNIQNLLQNPNIAQDQKIQTMRRFLETNYHVHARQIERRNIREMLQPQHLCWMDCCCSAPTGSREYLCWPFSGQDEASIRRHIVMVGDIIKDMIDEVDERYLANKEALACKGIEVDEQQTMPLEVIVAQAIEDRS